MDEKKLNTEARLLSSISSVFANEGSNFWGLWLMARYVLPPAVLRMASCFGEPKTSWVNLGKQEKDSDTMFWQRGERGNLSA